MVCRSTCKSGELVCVNHTKQNGEIVSCPICLQTVEEDVYHLSCGHVFHRECFRLIRIMKCPVCREVPTNVEGEIVRQIEMSSRDTTLEPDMRESVRTFTIMAFVSELSNEMRMRRIPIHHLGPIIEIDINSISDDHHYSTKDDLIKKALRSAYSESCEKRHIDVDTSLWFFS
jgi:hypothetical protein